MQAKEKAHLINDGNEFMNYRDDWYIIASKPEKYLFVLCEDPPSVCGWFSVLASCSGQYNGDLTPCHAFTALPFLLTKLGAPAVNCTACFPQVSRPC